MIAKLKFICLHFRNENSQIQVQRASTSAGMQNINHAIQRRVAKWQGILTVEFQKFFPNLAGAHVVIDEQNFLALCPICHLSYSVIHPGRNSLNKRNFIGHLKRQHLNINLNNCHTGSRFASSSENQPPDSTRPIHPSTANQVQPLLQQSVNVMPIQTRVQTRSHALIPKKTKRLQK